MVQDVNRSRRLSRQTLLKRLFVSQIDFVLPPRRSQQWREAVTPPKCTPADIHRFKVDIDHVFHPLFIPQALRSKRASKIASADTLLEHHHSARPIGRIDV